MLSSLVGTSKEVKNSLISKRSARREGNLQDVALLYEVVRSDMSTFTKVAFSAYCFEVVSGDKVTENLLVNQIKLAGVDLSLVTEFQKTLFSLPEKAAKDIAKNHFGTPPREKQYLNKVIGFLLSRNPALDRIFDGCLTAKERRELCL